MADAKFESLTEATSGAFGALVSTTVLYPLDTCKAKYQAEVGSNGRKKYRSLSDVLFEAISKGQIVSLYQGLGTKNLQSVIAQFVYFYGYSYFKRLYIAKSRAKSIGTLMNLIIAAAAGTCTAFITQPLDTAASRMQTSSFGKSKGLWATLSNGSWTEAFDGLSISLLLTSNPAIQYTIFDQLKQRFTKQQQSVRSSSSRSALSSPETLSASSAFLLGAVSKSVATFITYPLIRCKIMIQASEPEDDAVGPISGPERTLIRCLSSTWREEGIAGLFKGLQAQILKTVLSSALLLMVKERISRLTWIALLAFRQRLLISKKRVRNE